MVMKETWESVRALEALSHVLTYTSPVGTFVVPTKM
jgi:hypothetical protein